MKPIALEMSAAEALLLLHILIEWHNIHCHDTSSPFVGRNCELAQAIISRLWIPVLDA